MHKRGFTLVELLVVIAIIGILTGIIVPNLTESRKSARDAKRVSDIKQIQLALALYYNDNGFYPRKYTDQYTPSDGVTPTDGLLGTYISSLPKDPSTGNDYRYTSLTTAVGLPTCNSATSFPPVLYHLGAALETNHSALSDDTPSTYFTSVSAGGGVASGITYTRCNVSDTNFHPDSATCTETSASTDRCYDFVSS